MKRLLTLGIVLAVLCGVAWGVGAILTQTAAQRWLDARAAEGWVAHASDIGVGGFPLRFVTEFEGVELADPETGLAWSAPWFRFEQDALRLDRITAFWPDDQIISSPLERLTISGMTMQAELDVQPANRFALDGATWDMGPLSIQSTAGWQTALEQGSLIVRRQGDSVSTYEMTVSANAMTPPEAWRDRLDPAGVLPVVISLARADGVVTFDRPWDLDAIEQARPQITQIDLEEVRAEWGDMLFRASGTLEVTPTGVPEGELAVRAENWRAMLSLATNAGVVPERFEPTAEAMLNMLAGLSGQPENIDATLSFENGRIFLGPLPLGPAPNLRLR
ncbi:DUF2125 domain-containing protein [Gymnodinialimonas sp. 2305UL16-5]|uniref:DUF2125 domain-containing protein n=1 Tax=Gymnodinialimonas mytili TaxID=3126503 RepID=UPI0030A3B5E7